MEPVWLWFVAASLALLALVAGWRLGALASGGWAALVALGQAASLALVTAGPGVGYQHLALPFGAFKSRPLAASVAVAFVAVAIGGVFQHRRQFAQWLAGGSHRWSAGIALLGGSLLAAAPSLDLAKYASELVFASLLQLASLASVAIAAHRLPDESLAAFESGVSRWLSVAERRPGLDLYVWSLAAFVAVVATALCLTSYQAVPHIPDEIAYLVQANYFAAGLPWMAAPPVPQAFDTFLMEVAGDRWYSVFPPGWPLVLAVGVKLGVPWLVNPVLGGVCVLLSYRLVLELSDRRLARLSATLLALSPWHLLLSMSFMSHALSLALALVTALGALRAWRTGDWRPALVGGLALGVLGMSRPLEGIAMGLLAGIPVLVAAVRRARFAALSAALAGTLVTGGLGMAYNKLITGSPLRFPAEQYFDREYGPGKYGIGFGSEKGVGWTGLDPFPGHDLRGVAVNSVLNGHLVNIELLGWAAGSMFLLLLGVFAARKPIDRMMVTVIFVVVGLHSAYWFSGGPDFGARYWYLIIVPAVVLVSSRLLTLEGNDPIVPSIRAIAAAGWLSILALGLFVPWRAIDKYRHYRGVRPDLVSLSTEPRFQNSLLLVTGQRHPDWAGAVVANPIRLGDSALPVFAWNRDSSTRRAVLEAFPDRDVWLIDGPTVTGDGYRINLGPIAPADRERLLGKAP